MLTKEVLHVLTKEVLHVLTKEAYHVLKIKKEYMRLMNFITCLKQH